ncbi:hypothetical protein Nepgr_000872 [Nepenthes gracilis]|uniref:Protein TIFY n=1 Tax=Nepenthes gracilis TaxID=150966 RepID=A0AAD3P615_NEPGR|nr:hypothetical protein Nepgr_000872 [Nepenthes gracilis]
MAAVVVKMMGQSSKSNAVSDRQAKQPAVFHDFLGEGGRNCDCDPPVILASMADKPAADVGRLSEASPSASGSVGASSGCGRGPFSTLSDLGSGRQVGNQFRRIGSYGPRSDFSLADMNNRFVGSKRNNSDSAFMGASWEGLPQMGPESIQSSHTTKMLRHGGGGEGPLNSHYDGPFRGVQPIRPGSASLVLQAKSSNNADVVLPKWDQSNLMNMGGSMQFIPRMGQASPLGYQLPLNRFRDGTSGPSILSPTAADEGSRTGIKGSGIFSSINSSRLRTEKNPCTIPGSSTIKPANPNSEPESSYPLSQNGLTSVSRQMTIIYGGHVHVFDDVHPNKADIIMALAGSNGGSWSTTLPKSTTRSTYTKSCTHIEENETGGITAKDVRTSVRAADSSVEDK